MYTFTRLNGSDTRLDGEDRAAFASLSERLADPANITGVQIQVDSTMGDYDRYSGFDKTMLAGLTFVHHEYLYGGSGSPDEDMTITVTLYKPERHPIVENILRRWDEAFGTDYTRRTENMILHRDGDVFRVIFGEVSFTAECAAMTEWIEERSGM